MDIDDLRAKLRGRESASLAECSELASKVPSEAGVSDIAGDADIDHGKQVAEKVNQKHQSRQLSSPSHDLGAKYDHDASTSVITLSEYLRTVVQQLERQQNEADTEHSKLEVLGNQVATLKELETVLAIRFNRAPFSTKQSSLRTDCSSTTAKGGAQIFDESTDEDEVLLCLFREVDEDVNGKISIEELSKAPLLQKKENAEMGRVLQRALGCDLQALGEALAPLADEDLVLYSQRGADSDASSPGNGQGRASGRGAAVRAIFDAIGPSRLAAVSPEADPAAGVAGEGVARMATRADIHRFLAGADARLKASALGDTLRKLASALPADEQLDFLAFKEAAHRVPRVAAQRLEWVRTMGLDAALARHLPPGTLDDG